LLQWAVVDVWYDRHATELARPFLESLLASVRLGTSIPATIVLTLPVIAVVIATRAVLSRLLGVERAKRSSFYAAVTDGFALQFVLTAGIYAFCFGTVVLASVAPYLWPTGLLGEPALPNDWQPTWLPYAGIAGLLLPGLVPPASALMALRAFSPSAAPLKNVMRLALTLLVCGLAAFLSSYFIYIAQLIHKGTDLLDRRAVATTCNQVVVRVADNVLDVRLSAWTSTGGASTSTGGATTVIAGSPLAVEFTLLVSNGSARTLIFSRRPGRLLLSGEINPRKPADHAPLTALYLKPAESTIVAPGSVAAIPVTAMLSSSAVSGLDDIQRILEPTTVEYDFSFIGNTEEFRYHGESPASRCTGRFHAAKWIVRNAEAAVTE
jgi:hypothetical protein